MASNKKSTPGRSKSSTKRKYSAGKSNSRKKSSSKRQEEIDFSMQTELLLFAVLAFSIIVFIGAIGKGGIIGGALSAFFFGLFGKMAYIFPFLLFFFTAFLVSNLYDQKQKRKLPKYLIMKASGCILLYWSLCTFCHLVCNRKKVSSLISLYEKSAGTKQGGGIFGGLLGCGLVRGFGFAGAFIIVILLIFVSLVLMTQKHFFRSVHAFIQNTYAQATSEETKEKRIKEKERRELARQERQQQREERELEQKRMEKRVRGVSPDTKLETPDDPNDIENPKTTVDAVKKATKKGPSGKSNSMREITLDEIADRNPMQEIDVHDTPVIKNTLKQSISEEPEVVPVIKSYIPSSDPKEEDVDDIITETVPIQKVRQPKLSQDEKEQQQKEIVKVASELEKKISENIYEFPSVDLLQKGDPNATGDSEKYLLAMRDKLQSTLTNFGVNARVTNVICGPTVTQYEVVPEMGVKVSKILNLADDIKLNLAVADIRIEAPIPGKSAIGIEVPNKKNVTVPFRDMIESKEFQSHPSKISFCAGKDIAGNVIMADIAKMPHVLIAGSTGSGKSVCINTIIMSILYHATPDEVKLIMIDPKVVELSVYNGIPHLLIPVVTDPKKAAGALNWAVAEMTDRYNKFADYGVRDMKGFNKKVDAVNADPQIKEEDKLKKMPQIVVIVDELADLMMVAPGDVEDAICRLAQLARAAGIHLIIATQRPSVNVITGLIKANMPSRIAFAVTSGVDSRTILDMNGAEKLLGKGDMLFYPQGYAKPLRVQGAFVTDKEVADVVNFIKETTGPVTYNADVEEKMANSQSMMSASTGDSTPGNDRDAYFKEAGKFIIEKEKGSIGMLQRMFKIGFNRAARIMDQLEEAGVVGPEEGTKPRRVLMTLEEFEQLDLD